MQIPEHMACRERTHEQFFRVIAQGIAAETGIARARQRRLARECNGVVAAVGFVAAGALAVVAGPFQLKFVVMLFHTRLFLRSPRRSPRRSANFRSSLRGRLRRVGRLGWGTWRLVLLEDACDFAKQPLLLLR